MSSTPPPTPERTGNPWITYVNERFPLPTYALLIGGFVCSQFFLPRDAQPTLLTWILGPLGLLLFFAELRLMDEYKDFEKDELAHPERPLPRGLLQIDTVGRVIDGGAIAMLVLAGVAAAVGHLTAGLIFAGVTVYLWLMYKEFYVGERLAAMPLLYAITHQVILIPLVFDLLALVVPQETLASDVNLGLSLVALGGFFAYEVCRKLDPKAHPVLGTYLYHYGKSVTVLIVGGCLLVGAYGAMLACIGHVIWPTEAILLLSLAVLFIDHTRFKIVEGVATLALAIHLWGGALATWIPL